MQPYLAKKRLETVDILRGTALMGIILAHFSLWHTAGPLPHDVISAHSSISEKAVTTFNNIFVTGKFFTFFSFLFGFSFYLQLGNSNKKSRSAILRFAWRLILLLLIGLAHHAFWLGDILLVYVPIGFSLLLLRHLSDKWVLLLAFVLSINVPGKLIYLAHLQTGLFEPSTDLNSFSDAYHQVISQGSWLHIFTFNLKHLYAKIEFQLFSGRLFISLGFCLLGMYVGRRKWLEQLYASKDIICKTYRHSAVATGTTLAAFIGFNVVQKMLPAGAVKKYAFGLITTCYDIMSAAMTVLIISSLVLLSLRKSWTKLLQPLAAVGKMTLSIYLMQTAAGLLLFYNVGFGLYAQTSPLINYFIAALLFCFQVMFSNWWMRHFQYGPVEWLWRSGTLLQWQALRRKPHYHSIAPHSNLHSNGTKQLKKAV